MATAVVLPELGTDNEALRLSAWLVEPGDTVIRGDNVAEVLLRGMTFAVEAPESGVFTEVEKPLDAVVSPGDVLGWIEPETIEDTGPESTKEPP